MCRRADLINREKPSCLGRGCPVLEKFVFPCPHVFPIWLRWKCAASPPLTAETRDSRKPYCTPYEQAALAAAATLIPAWLSRQNLDPTGEGSQGCLDYRAEKHMGLQLEWRRSGGDCGREDNSALGTSWVKRKIEKKPKKLAHSIKDRPTNHRSNNN